MAKVLFVMRATTHFHYYRSIVEAVAKRGYEVERHEADISKAIKLLKWKPKVDIVVWLKKFIKTL